MGNVCGSFLLVCDPFQNGGWAGTSQTPWEMAEIKRVAIKGDLARLMQI